MSEDLLRALGAAVGRARTNMSARADRHYRLQDAQIHLEAWRDHGDPSQLEQAIALLRGEA